MQEGIRIVGVVGIVIVLPLWCGCNSEARERAKEKQLSEQRAASEAAHAQVAAFKTPLACYRLDTGDFPTTVQGLQSLCSVPKSLPDAKKWRGPYLKGSVPVDPWGRAYRYVYPGVHDSSFPDISSDGPDGKGGNEDDIGSW
jgi:general secretion pathway protein G